MIDISQKKYIIKISFISMKKFFLKVFLIILKFECIKKNPIPKKMNQERSKKHKK